MKNLFPYVGSKKALLKDIDKLLIEYPKDNVFFVFSFNGKMIIYDAENEEPLAVLRQTEIIDYLRSNSYDCGYGDIPSLIAANIAIDKTS